MGDRDVRVYCHFGERNGRLLSLAWHGALAFVPPDGMARSLHGRRFKAGGTGKVAGEVRETHSRA